MKADHRSVKVADLSRSRRGPGGRAAGKDKEKEEEAVISNITADTAAAKDHVITTQTPYSHECRMRIS